jgi:dTDP-4-dehydrorhamnose 3,5-epimerase
VIFQPTALEGAFVLEPERLSDERGFFARTWCAREAEHHGLDPRVVQCSTSYNKTKGTLRGMHFQVAPHEEAKLVRCTRGAVYDVIIDLRPSSPAFTRHVAVMLSAENGRAIYVPEGFAHGFQTLEDDSEVLYQMSTFYVPSHSRGVRWNDPAFRIAWPPAERIITDRDRRYPDFTGLSPT